MEAILFAAWMYLFTMPAGVECNSFHPALVGHYPSYEAARADWEAHGGDDAMACVDRQED